jgi:hypothetical protein
MVELPVFAQMPTTPEPIIAQVQRDLVHDSTGVASADIAVLAETAVRHLWDSRVKGFIPILALREVREALAAQDQVIYAVPTSLSTESAPSSTAPQTHPEPWQDALPLPVDDLLPIGDDVLPLTDDDVLPLVADRTPETADETVAVE